MEEHVGIAVAHGPLVVFDHHTAKHEAGARFEPMRVVAEADAEG
jgi:hypothetical protein